MKDDSVWGEIERRFKAIIDRTGTLRADYSRTPTSGETWRLAGGDKLVRRDFEIEAQRAGRVALAKVKDSQDPSDRILYLELPNCTDPMDLWLNLLRIRGNGYELGLAPGMPWALPIAVNNDGSEEIMEVGSIHQVIEHSARMCNLLRNDEESARFRASTLLQPAHVMDVPPPTVVITDDGHKTGSVVRRHGFKADMDRHEEISRIVERYDSGWKNGSRAWRDNSLLESICSDLDSGEIDIPENWRSGTTPKLDGAKLKSWRDAFELGYKKLVTDQIGYSLKMVITKTTPGHDAF